MDTYLNAPPELKTAIKAYLQSHQLPTSVEVGVEKADQGLVRARVTLANAQADPAFAFVREEAGAYRVLGLGTFFEPEFYQAERVPPSMRI